MICAHTHTPFFLGGGGCPRSGLLQIAIFPWPSCTCFLSAQEVKTSLSHTLSRCSAQAHGGQATMGLKPLNGFEG